jgi:hypothetical protein
VLDGFLEMRPRLLQVATGALDGGHDCTLSDVSLLPIRCVVVSLNDHIDRLAEMVENVHIERSFNRANAANSIIS